ncbi:MAG: glycosyltransferase family 4 protein [Candidatus Sumerlaeia bacterium]|nr:glycosyltransferase family 4 protein [Candidatus Sumerlaeia bacterium]
MRFLFINQYYLPDYAATAQPMADVCERLAADGHEVHVITSRALYDGRQMELPRNETLRGVHVHRVSLATASRARFRHRLVGFVSFMAGAFWRAHRLPRPDVVVTLTTPPLVSLLGAWIKQVRRTSFVYWVMDIYPEIAERAGVLRRMGPINPIWSRLAGLGYAAADRLVVLGSDMRDVLSARGVAASKIEVLPNWAHADLIHPVPPETNAFRRQHLRPGQFTVMYSGNMGACHTFCSLFRVLPQLNGKDAFDFLFVGSGRKQGELVEKLGGLGDRVRFLPYQERESLSESLSAPEAHLVTLDPRFDGLLVPSKIYGIMAAARPILFIGSEDNDVARTIREARCGVRVPPEDPEAMMAALRAMAADPEETVRMGLRGRAHFEQNFERREATARFVSLLERQAWVGAPGRDTPHTPSDGVADRREIPLSASGPVATPVAK